MKVCDLLAETAEKGRSRNAISAQIEKSLLGDLRVGKVLQILFFCLKEMKYILSDSSYFIRILLHIKNGEHFNNVQINKRLC